MNVEFSTISCGVGELSNGINQSLLSQIEDILDFEIENDTEKAFYIWSNIEKRKGSDVKVDTWGHKLAKDIKDNQLGEVTVVGPAVNPNTENAILMWLWKVDREALIKWAGKHGL